MASERLADGARPAGGVGEKHVLRIYRHADRVETARGMWPVARLRPGDSLVLTDTGVRRTVQWLAMSRGAPAGEIVIRVMLGEPEIPHASVRALPLAGWISRVTGRLMFGRKPPPGAAHDPAQ